MLENVNFATALSRNDYTTNFSFGQKENENMVPKKELQSL
jgi:hypothetical protein